MDLGLPSGTKWATMNVGASSETDYGNYYMYGKGNSTYNTLDAAYTGTENPLASSADAATQVWGDYWHIPTKAQFEELFANTTYEWTTINSVNGGKFTANNGNYVFFPAAGSYLHDSINGVGNYGEYLSSTPYDDTTIYYMQCYDSDKFMPTYYREAGFSVRGVMNSNPASKVAITGSYNDLSDKPTIPQIWSGTQAQYTALGPDYNSNTIYIITSAS